VWPKKRHVKALFAGRHFINQIDEARKILVWFDRRDGKVPIVQDRGAWMKLNGLFCRDWRRLFRSFRCSPIPQSIDQQLRALTF
jgi:hypothetical protein